MRDIKVYYQPIDGQRTDLAIFSKQGRSDMFIESVETIEQQEDVLLGLIIEGMFQVYSSMEEEVIIQRWMDCYVTEIRMEWM